MSSILRRQLSKLDVVKYIQTQGQNYGYGEVKNRTGNSDRTVIVEYSSPNIAKPFHAGHLRSTILGNFIGNLYENLGWQVIRLNYLGDWGTQFGLLTVGFQRHGDEQAFRNNPLQHLFEVYVKINSEVAVEKTNGSSDTQQDALEVFRKMEQGDTDYLQMWKKFRDVSLEEYMKTYKRLGIKFTEYHSESMYNESSMHLVQKLKDDGVIQIDQEGKGYININSGKPSERQVSVIKSDGTTLYITRDISALLDRYDKYKFDKIHYVVENGQHLHFECLSGIMSLFPDWKNRINDDLHIKFGRIDGMSTRRGQVVFLKDILDEAKNRTMESMRSHQTTKVDGDYETVADILGKSAIIVQDLGQRRLKNYKFSWDRVLNFKQDSGVFMQYCHARLSSIERKSELEIDNNFQVDHLLLNKEAEALLSHLLKYEDKVQESFETLEPYHIVKYLYQLCHSVNAAYRTCHVKNTDPDKGKAYLHMFSASRITLSNGMHLLGIQPLEKM